MRQRIIYLFFIAAITILATTWIAADDSLHTSEPPSSKAEFGELIEVSEVLLDVLVTDRRGNVILGLDKDDFVVKENGQDVDLSEASFYSNRFEIRDDDPSRIKKPAANEVPADRYFIFFFHDQLHRGPGASRLVRQQFEAGRRTQAWIREQMLPGDWVAVASYDYKLKVHQDFTRSREALLRAVDNATRGKDPQNTWLSRHREVPEGVPSLFAYLPSGNDLRDETTRIYDGLELVSDATRDIVGRKSLIFFSTGFGRFDTPLGRQAALVDDRFYPALRESLNDNNVAVYSVDLTPTGAQSSQQSSLTEISSDTGGEYFGTFTNFITPLKEIADEANGYYLLSYQAEHPAGKTGYRKVKVKTRDPNFKIKARRGYRYGT